MCWNGQGTRHGTSLQFGWNLAPVTLVTMVKAENEISYQGKDIIVFRFIIEYIVA
jgi:hypothetical protein